MRVALVIARACRGSLLLGALLSTSCLIAEPPDLKDPERLGPRALVQTANPLVTEPYLTSNTGSAPTFYVEFLAENLGESVLGRLYLNFYAEGERYLGKAAAAAPLRGDDRSSVSVPWTNNRNEPEGCYTVTLAITYEDNFSDESDERPIDLDQTALVTWYVAHRIPPQDVTLDECYPPDPLPQDTE